MKDIVRLLINFFRHLLFLVKVEGESGWPTLVSGKRYLATNLILPQQGDFLVFRNQHDCEVYVKQIAEVRRNGYMMESTVSWGSSSRDFGMIPFRATLGVVLL